MNNNRIPFCSCFLLLLFLFGCNKNSPGTEKNDEGQDDLPVALTDEELLDLVQEQTINYFWEGAEPISGMARERLHMDGVYPANDRDVVATGGTGFGLMALLAGVERGFISRSEVIAHFDKIVTFLETADRFHGAWPHWMNPDGSTVPFSPQDDGGDLVETAFLVQGLLTVKEYLDREASGQAELSQRIQQLWEEVEWSWYTRGGENVLYWHWSPNFGWAMNFPIGGYNECLILYILAASSPTHPISKAVYDEGWARNGNIRNDTLYYGLRTQLDHYEFGSDPVGPLFWAHYSYLGLNPGGLTDAYADYWELNRNQALIHYRYCVENPNDYRDYGADEWGLTSSYSINGYDAHRPGNDLGVISPTAAISSIPYTPEESMDFLRKLYTEKDSLVGKYGPYDAYSAEYNWYLPRYLAIDQGPIPVMIENYRSGLFWDLFMSNEEVRAGLEKLGFNYSN
ncbi:glucoamylase family protein [Lentiprolixibacter aurantiacus]|uniref:Beta-glucosidase n=1 Tax=Lentiprolixibacter aurantiacus TaxID=2993939 RepID=A0AAE3MJ78_9FLAO|nr:glucoamylase family protein [Lentiprolixibacter aurantiacus]MCX2718429.1 beta-glucosidase [Lentiprolixibacter aurantiacus]